MNRVEEPNGSAQASALSGLSNPVPVPGALAAENGNDGATGAPRLGLIGLIVAILIVAGVLAGYLPRRHRTAALIDENKELSIPSVSVAHPAHAKNSSAISLPAEIRPLLESPIYSRANGFIKRWMVDIGSEVDAGQLLAEIDSPEVGQELAQSKAQLLQAEAALALAQTTAKRWEELLKTSSVSEQEAAEKASDLALKSATVEAARANVRRLEELQSFTRVTAPFAGTITARYIDVGELIQPNKQLFRLAQTQTLRVFARVPQTMARAVTIGQTAELTIPEIPNHVFKAKVVRTSGAMAVDSRTLLVELELPNRKNEILSGAFAQVRFPDARPASALVVPGNAIIFRSEGSQLALANKDTVELRKVALGRDFGSSIEVVSGVNEQDSVILNPADSLVSGMKVRIAPSNAAGAQKP